ncbi:MAG: NPCBM/NEW2 domain-containing protein [Candidatus Hydrogenedentales bacterium]
MSIWHHRYGTFIFLSLFLFAFLCMSVDAAEKGIHLADLESELTVQQGWGNLGKDRAAYPTDGQGMTLCIGEKEYGHGLGHHAPGEIVLPIDGRFLSFTAEVGVQWQGGGKGSVSFEVWVDDKKCFESGCMSDSDAAKPVEVDLVDAKILRLVASDCGDGIANDMANWAHALLMEDRFFVEIGAARFSPATSQQRMEGSYALLGKSEGAQLAFSRPLHCCTLMAAAHEEARIDVPLGKSEEPMTAVAVVSHAGGAPASLSLSFAGGLSEEIALKGGESVLCVSSESWDSDRLLSFVVDGGGADAAVRLTQLYLVSGDRKIDIDFFPEKAAVSELTTPTDILAHPLILQEMLEWDWRMQDGIGAGAVRCSYREGAESCLEKGNRLAAQLEAQQLPVSDDVLRSWFQLKADFEALRLEEWEGDSAPWQELWREVHQRRRALLFAHPLADTGALLFVKQAPGMFSHQLTQVYGRYARPGGGLYVLDDPLHDMGVRRLAEDMPTGSFMQPEVDHAGERIIVAFCRTEGVPQDSFNGTAGQFYHLYEISKGDGSWRPLTEGAYDDFSPKELPNGQIIFISTRRGGWHRCGTPGCEVYTLTLMNADGGDVRVLSFHETQEWDPAVLNDGRVIYTRWDYVDRDAVHYQHLWITRPDGTAPAAFYGNNTFNPVGLWEARSVPGSHRVMATAAPHHGMTAGSIVLVDPTVAIDGLDALERLTPHVPFPESESLLLPHWRSALAPDPPAVFPETERWPGQCFRSPWPLAEDLFLAAYSFDPLIGEPKHNDANIFGLYLVDAYGNQELLYRDLNIASLWPMPLKAREKAPVLPSLLEDDAPQEGSYYVQNVYESDPALPEDTPVTHLRIVQVLPKSTSGANNPTVGAANASPGKQVLGTVPVEEDGSAYFIAPSGKALSFQALDASGQAVQVMRSVSYLQPGERLSCVGCHENRMDAPSKSEIRTLAQRRAPSRISEAPDGALPLSYPILVQPVLDKHCVHCHGEKDAQGPDGKAIHLTGRPEGRYTQSYNALISRVSYAAWGHGGPFPDGNCEPLAEPGFFGAKGSALTKLLEKGHHNVELDDDDWERLVTWMDANALFYGSFEFDDQERQQRGERISAPGLE